VVAGGQEAGVMKVKNDSFINSIKLFKHHLASYVEEVEISLPSHFSSRQPITNTA
jgi:hypothetical protein